VTPSVAAAGGVVLIAIMILRICIRRQLRAQHHHQEVPKAVPTEGSKYSGRSIAAGDEEEDSDNSHTYNLEEAEHDDESVI
jgi:hypothetical protein